MDYAQDAGRSQAQDYHMGGAQDRVLNHHPTQCQVVCAIQPLLGFTAFAATSTYGHIAYQQTWPNGLYKTLTEIWKSNGVTIRVRTFDWQQFVDAPMVVTDSAPGSYGAPDTTLTVTDTVCTKTWTDSGNTLTYSATLSVPISDTFDSATAVAQTLLDGVTLPPISAPGTIYTQNRQQIVYALSGGGTAILDTDLGTAFWAPMLLAANGAAVLPGAGWVGGDYPNGFNFSPEIIGFMDQSVCDISHPMSWSLYTTFGAVMCVKSRWKIASGPTGFAWLGSTPNDPHRVYGQKVDFSGLGGSPSGYPRLTAPIMPADFVHPDQLSLAGVLEPNPIAAWTRELVFNWTDVVDNLGGYGILGLRYPAV